MDMRRGGGRGASMDEPAASRQHESESSVDAVETDLVIDNDGTLEHLGFVVRHLLRFGDAYELRGGATATLVGARRGCVTYSVDDGASPSSSNCETCSVEAWLGMRPIPLRRQP